MSLEDQLRNRIARLEGENARLRRTMANVMLEFAETNIEFVDEPLRTEAVSQALSQRNLPEEIVSTITGMLPQQTAMAWRNPRVEEVFEEQGDEYWEDATMTDKLILFFTKNIDRDQDPPDMNTNFMLYNRLTKTRVATLMHQQQIYGKPAITESNQFCVHFSLGGPLYIRSCENLEVLRVEAPIVFGFRCFNLQNTESSRDRLFYCTENELIMTRLESHTPTVAGRGVFSSIAYMGVAPGGMWIRTREVTHTLNFKEHTSTVTQEFMTVERMTPLVPGLFLSELTVRDANGRRRTWMVNLKLGSTWKREIVNMETILPISNEIYVTHGGDDETMTLNDVYGHSIKLNGTPIAAYKGELLVRGGRWFEMFRARWTGAVITPLP